ncbi:MAG: UpxY family transcription antiterminator [Bacteroides sp.]|nr:UpxY family transcription antiterminator [Bacteroides sp.]
MKTINTEGQTQWFVMRDLKRSNAKLPAYKMLMEEKIELFVPMKWQLVIRAGKRVRMEVPFMQDLLFVRDTRLHLTPIVDRTLTLQYRWLKGTYREPMVVPDKEMERFIFAARSSSEPKYYLPEEITPEMYGRKILIVGGQLDGYEGYLLTTRGSKVKRLLVELQGFLAVGVEVNPEYIQLI